MEAPEAARNDQFARHVGIQILETREGFARVRMCIAPHHLNGMGMVHGGAIFSLADLAFEAACNSHGYQSVAINVSISYVKPASAGTLYAEAMEVATEGRLGCCTVRVTDDGGDLVALFQGLSYRKGPPPAPRA